MEAPVRGGFAVRRALERAASLVNPLVRGVQWLFEPRAPGVDLTLALFALAWGGLMVLRPEIFDRDSYSGLTVLPDIAWIVGFSSLVGVHLLGMWRLHWRSMRITGCLVSSWAWYFVAFSLGRVDITTGVLTYGIVGSAALAGAIYIAGLRPLASP